ncbi:MAG: zinc ribbon domain-containing protein [Planctomycetes bacterium]|nr:zinc ribbon domain-containing protein [Planctomycetota bacterium]
MPTYEYECNRCFHRFEKYQTISQGAIRKCPNCGRATAKRLISAGAGLLFKGSGFYITDYRSAEYKTRAKADQAPGTSNAADGAAASTASTATTNAPAAKPAAASPAPAPAPAKAAAASTPTLASSTK